MSGNLEGGLMHDAQTGRPPSNPSPTLRQWYAGLAMQGILAGNTSLSMEATGTARLIARAAFMVADAMLVAEKEKP